MTENHTSQIDLEAETIIDLTTDQSPQPVEDRRTEPEDTIDLTGDPDSVRADENDAGADVADENTSADRVVAEAAELLEQIDAEAELSAQPSDSADDTAAEPEAIPEPVAHPAASAESAEPVADVPLRRVLEAVLLIAEDPLPVMDIASRLEVPAPEVEAAIRELAAEYEQQERGFALREVAGGWRYYTAAECAPEVERFLLAGQTSRLSQAALETLAVVAYQQPVSRSRIAAVRGVSVDGVMKTLVSRGLIAESGTDTESGAIMYVTTPKFLERLGLRDLSELPPLAPLLPGLDELPED